MYNFCFADTHVWLCYDSWRGNFGSLIHHTIWRYSSGNANCSWSSMTAVAAIVAWKSYDISTKSVEDFWPLKQAFRYKISFDSLLYKNI